MPIWRRAQRQPSTARSPPVASDASGCIITRFPQHEEQRRGALSCGCASAGCGMACWRAPLGPLGKHASLVLDGSRGKHMPFTCSNIRALAHSHAHGAGAGVQRAFWRQRLGAGRLVAPAANALRFVGWWQAALLLPHRAASKAQQEELRTAATAPPRCHPLASSAPAAGALPASAAILRHLGLPGAASGTITLICHGSYGNMISAGMLHRSHAIAAWRAYGGFTRL